MDEYYRERRATQLQAQDEKKKKLLTDDYTDYLMYSCEKCNIRDSCPYQPSIDPSNTGCQLRAEKFIEKFKTMQVTGDENVDRAIRLLAKFEVEMDLHLIDAGGKSTKNSVALLRTLVHGYLRVQEALKGRTVNINRTDILGINAPEVEAIEQKLKELEKWKQTPGNLEIQ